MPVIEALRKVVEDRIEQLKFTKQPINLYEPINYTLQNQGKRIRPVLSLLACKMFSDNIDNAVDPAIGLEVFHNFTLLHDDIMDAAPVRRGNPTVHIKWNPNTAILSGDTMMVEAYKLVTKAPDYCLRQVLDLFSDTAIGVCEGQMYDMEFETSKSVSESEYMHMITLKTSVLIAAALKMGAIIGNASKTDAELMYQFGLNLGIAFQLLDDWLDAYSDPKVFGKKTGGDIVANKKTFLLISALEKANVEQKAELEHWIKQTIFIEEEKIEAIIKIYNELGIQNLTLAKAKAYSEIAFTSLDKINISDDKKLPLRQLGEALLNRVK